MQIVLILTLVASVVLFVFRTRFKRDRELVTKRVSERGGQVIRLKRVRKGSPFADTSRGWWAWCVLWRNARGDHTSWALTTREGLSEWRD